MSWPAVIRRLESGKSVVLHPKGNSMTPRIKSGQRIVLSPISDAVRVGDICLAKVKGRFYLHLVTAIDKDGGRWQISNNHGHINGYARQLFGVVTEIGDNNGRKSRRNS